MAKPVVIRPQAGTTEGMPSVGSAEETVLQISVPCAQTAPRTVRHRLLEASYIGSIMGDAALVASELVTNAVRHSSGEPSDQVVVSVDRRVDCLRIAVRDPGLSGRSAAVVESPDGIGGLGLRLVEHLTRCWGTERDDTGYTVWGELPLER